MLYGSMPERSGCTMRYRTIQCCRTPNQNTPRERGTLAGFNLFWITSARQPTGESTTGPPHIARVLRLHPSSQQSTEINAILFIE